MPQKVFVSQLDQICSGPSYSRIRSQRIYDTVAQSDQCWPIGVQWISKGHFTHQKKEAERKGIEKTKYEC